MTHQRPIHHRRQGDASFEEHVRHHLGCVAKGDVEYHSIGPTFRLAIMNEAFSISPLEIVPNDYEMQP
jgi:hypothetical protein